MSPVYSTNPLPTYRSILMEANVLPNYINFTLDVTPIHGSTDMGGHLRISEEFIALTGTTTDTQPYWSFQGNTYPCNYTVSASSGVCPGMPGCAVRWVDVPEWVRSSVVVARESPGGGSRDGFDGNQSGVGSGLVMGLGCGCLFLFTALRKVFYVTSKPTLTRGSGGIWRFGPLPETPCTPTGDTRVACTKWWAVEGTRPKNTALEGMNPVPSTADLPIFLPSGAQGNLF